MNEDRPESGGHDGPKPEYLTHLCADVLVPKTHGRIRFRGILDSLEADVIEAQALASSLGEGWYTERLGETLDCLRRVLAAEVKETPLPEFTLFGLSEEELHAQSHNVRAAFGMDGHPVPDYTMGPLAVRLNTLRARIREGELLAVRVFWGGAEERPCGREDIIRVMNRLSSAFYWLFCRCISTGR
jgi:ethanolamine utilization cobalamin adenosyltransferase